MADSQSNIVTIVGILAVLILVGLAVYFVMRGGDDDAEFELEISGQPSLDAPAHVLDRTAAAPRPASLGFMS